MSSKSNIKVETRAGIKPEFTNTFSISLSDSKDQISLNFGLATQDNDICCVEEFAKILMTPNLAKNIVLALFQAIKDTGVFNDIKNDTGENPDEKNE